MLSGTGLITYRVFHKIARILLTLFQRVLLLVVFCCYGTRHRMLRVVRDKCWCNRKRLIPEQLMSVAQQLLCVHMYYSCCLGAQAC